MLSVIPWNAAFAAKAGALTAALAIGIALTLASAEASDEFGDSVSISPFGKTYGNPADVLGGPDGAVLQIGTIHGGGGITVSFDDNVAFNGPGADLRIHPLDSELPAVASIEVSADGVGFIGAGDFSDGAGAINLDLGALGLSFATAVRITYVSGSLPGFEVDAISALNQVDIDIALAPTPHESPGFTDHTVTATFTSSTATIEGVPINFEVTAGGPNAGVIATVNTDAAGAADFTWTGEGGPGFDTVEAWLDLNQNGIRDPGEPFAVAVQEWHGVTGIILIEDLDGGGLVVGDFVQVTVEDRDLDVTDGADTVEVNVSSDSDGIGFALTLTETGDHTGVFTGLFELGETTVPDTVLAAADGDVVTALYIDELDGEGDVDTELPGGLPVVGEEENGTKVTVCHIPPGNPGNLHTLHVGSSALGAHLGHGDYPGECGESDVLSKQEEQQELKAERDADREQKKADQDADREQERLEREAERLEAEAARDAAFCAKKGDDHSRCSKD